MLEVGLNDMKPRTIHRSLAWSVLPLVLIVWGFTYFFGPLDSVPRLHASAQRPDGAFTVKVYRQRISLGPPEIDMIAKVFDQRGNLIYQKKIYQEGMWSELENLFRNITFEGDEIRIGPKFSPNEYVVIKQTDLKPPY